MYQEYILKKEILVEFGFKLGPDHHLIPLQIYNLCQSHGKNGLKLHPKILAKFCRYVYLI